MPPPYKTLNEKEMFSSVMKVIRLHDGFFLSAKFMTVNGERES